MGERGECPQALSTLGRMRAGGLGKMAESSGHRGSPGTHSLAPAGEDRPQKRADPPTRPGRKEGRGADGRGSVQPRTRNVSFPQVLAG